MRGDDEHERFRGTTVLAVRRGAETVVAADGQVSFGNMIVKSKARKVRRLGDGGRVVVGQRSGARDD